jgi:hypothetical protein
VHLHNAPCGKDFGRPNPRGRENLPRNNQKSASFGAVLQHERGAAVQYAAQRLKPKTADRPTLPAPEKPVNLETTCQLARNHETLTKQPVNFRQIGLSATNSAP